MKTCTKCGESKPLDVFGRNKTSAGGRRSECNSCRAAAARLAPERQRAASRRFRDRHPDRQRAAERRWADAHPEYRVEVSRRRRAANRAAVLDHYGRSCACCGATGQLTIDHVNGNGAEHRAAAGIRTGTETMEWLVRNGLPAGFQTLCHPCNASKQRGESCRIDHGLCA